MVEEANKSFKISSSIRIFRIDVCCLEETQFSTRDHEDIMCNKFVLYLPFTRIMRGVSWLERISVEAACALIFEDTADMHCTLDITTKDKALCFVWVCAPNNHAERPDLFRQSEPFLKISRSVVSVGEYNALLDPDKDRIRERSGTKQADMKSFRNFIDGFYLVGKISQ